VGTVDKFARLAWEERASSFFGKNGSLPPELIIQDELHLISGALGSIVGLYEIAIDVTISSRGRNAKYIASTATIKNASRQVRTLFGREMAIFPPSGLRHDNSFFAKTVPLSEKPGRLYVGYLKPDPKIQQSIVPLAGSLLAAPTKLFKDDEQYLDNWWTQVIYHSSLKGLGESRTLYQNNIPRVLTEQTIQNLKEDLETESKGFTKNMDLESIGDFKKISTPELKKIVDQYIPVRSLEIKSLSSQNSAEENAEIFSNLEKEKQENGALDIALATNMVSVGLDVSRLAVMIIKGQPLTTSEYIQASSRVGRGSTPGVVFANYYYTQARSLSHYENFRSYHETFYRYVEPSSLTPFTYQARTRTLHAVLVIVARHGNLGLSGNLSAGEFDPESIPVKKAISLIKSRCKRALNNNEPLLVETQKHIDKLVSEWGFETEFCKTNKITLAYHSKDKGYSSLLCDFDKQDKGLWPTLQSMRNVENTALIKLLGCVKLRDEE
jgi:hypothetical protein